MQKRFGDLPVLVQNNGGKCMTKVSMEIVREVLKTYLVPNLAEYLIETIEDQGKSESKDDGYQLWKSVVEKAKGDEK